MYIYVILKGVVNMLKNIDILDLRIKGDEGYRLCETLSIVNNDIDNLNEATSVIGQGRQRVITLGLMSVLDDATGELSGLIAVVPLLYKNVYELHQSNKAIESAILSGQNDIAKLEALRNDLAIDVIDILNAIIIALPLPVIDTVGVSVINMLEDAIAGGAASLVSNQFEKLSENYPKLAQILSIVSYPFGGAVILKAFNNIDDLSPENLQNTLHQRRHVERELIDVTPRQNELPDNNISQRALPAPSLEDILSESKLQRWQVLSGITA
jgi:hypothetical protein